MSNLIVVTGPQAVGKMTVAEKLKEKLGFSLLVNHDSIEVSKKIFDSNEKAWRDLNRLIRENVFQIAVQNDVDLIFTFVVAFDLKEDIDYLKKLKELFESSGGKFYFVELEADLDTRLKRNVTPHRLEEKRSKRDTEWSKNELLETMEKYRLNSNEGEKLFENQLKINNTNLEPDEVADIVIDKFNLRK